jgi:serine/threonine-protein kinase RsbW
MDAAPASDDPPAAATRFAEFPSSLPALTELLEWFAAQEPSGVAPLVWVQAQTALVEGFTNAVRHAHGPMADPPPVRVEVTTRSEPRGVQLCLVIHDRGLPFDLQAAMGAIAPKPTCRGAVDQADDPFALPERDAHWGLVILARLRDRYGWQIDYQSLREGGNQLVLHSPLA